MNLSDIIDSLIFGNIVSPIADFDPLPHPRRNLFCDREESSVCITYEV